MVNSTSNRIKVYFGVFMLICLSVFPFVNDSRSLLILFTQIFIFAIFAMSLMFSLDIQVLFHSVIVCSLV